jgi:hypothetical protein
MKKGEINGQKSKIVYIASPYAGDIEQNVAFAIEACKYAIQLGYTPIAPHLMYPQMLDDSAPNERTLGLELGKRLLATADEIWLCGDKISNGMYAEMLEAMSLGIPQKRIISAEILEFENVQGTVVMSI